MAYVLVTGATGLVCRHLLRNLIAHSLKGPAYSWEAGTYHHEGVPVTFLAGYPQSAHQDKVGSSS